MQTVRVEDILWNAQADGVDVLRTNMLGPGEAQVLYYAILGWVLEDGTAPLYVMDFTWDSAFYSVEFFTTLFGYFQNDDECPDYFAALMAESVGLRQDPELYRLVELSFRRLDPDEVLA